MTEPSINDPPILDKIQELIALMGGSPDTYEGELVLQLIQTSLKLLSDKIDLGQLKLITRAMKEMRYAYRTFSQYPDSKKVSIFGSARTPENHPDYAAALEFSKEMAACGWMCITGAAEGIMKAGLEGVHKENRFGLSIRLPWEAFPNAHIEKDPKLIMFRYFFTRKLMFVSHADAFAAFPGGYGTLDELFEVLTLIQTGKSQIIPVVLVEGGDREYWVHWEHYLDKHLLSNGWISLSDKRLYYKAKDSSDAAQHIINFYKTYHSSRYVKEELVIRLNHELSAEKIEYLNKTYSNLIMEGDIRPVKPYPEESDALDKPRIAFQHTRKDFGILRSLIDDLN